MTGKGSLLLILGFSAIFLVLGIKFGQLSGRAVDNMVEYYEQTVAHDIAVSGANMAANEFFIDNTWNAGFNTTNFNGGTFKVDFTVVDVLAKIYKITSIGAYEGITKKVELVLKPSSFSKFAYLSTDDPTNLYWAGSDTIWGPFHSQGKINCYNHPVFYGKVTTKAGLHYYRNKSKDGPKLYGGFEDGVDIEMPPNGVSNAMAAAVAGGFSFSPLLYTSEKTVYLTFKGDSLSFKFKSSGPEVTVLTKLLAPNGVISVPNADIKLKGVVSGQYTVVTNEAVYLEDDIVYQTDPRKNSSSTDLLGIVAEEDITIAYNTANQNDINIDASIYSQNGGFGAGWNALQFILSGSTGNINLYGGIQNKQRVQIGVFNGDGFERNYKYDPRLALMSPPFYPGTGKFEIVSWYE